MFSVTPTPADTAGQQTITVKGENFGMQEGLVSVLLGSTPCSDVTLLSNTMLTCVSPEGSGVLLPVVVKVDTKSTLGQEGLGYNLFSYKAPVITNVSGCVDRDGATFNCHTPCMSQNTFYQKTDVGRFFMVH